ncbi:NAD-dependent epimerase/dehydratase family protein [Roseisalinus antarcticus]|uniref:dTDP-glucose 4,6-dehydratase n=1 Tax=Roseisalinus antarcticus TaxID=254357 RepID=A0A1Y5TED4_9RHOB|nr:SDR family oxidoreductase [Roseisalinus antarcticus]SLN61919.1 dTDP-glucose 4,6-dehydratase [Roseisalinus antarcticus]
MTELRSNEPVLVTGAYGLIGHSVTLALQAGGLPVVPTDLLADRPADAAFTARILDVGGVDRIARFLSEHGTLDLFEAARLTGVGRIVLVSSASVYGNATGPTVGEDAPLVARDAYGCSKIGGELVARCYAAEHGLDIVILRPAWVYGPRRRTPASSGA